ncbi:hypothetical protein KQ718_17490, partial [Listeria monocytogenes]|nr:hypothetical protein [Listeria monocytogenes]
PLQLGAADLGAAEIGATHQVQEPMQFAASGYRKRVQRSFWEGGGRALDKIGSGPRHACSNRLLPAAPGGLATLGASPV